MCGPCPGRQEHRNYILTRTTGMGWITSRPHRRPLWSTQIYEICVIDHSQDSRNLVTDGKNSGSGVDHLQNTPPSFGSTGVDGLPGPSGASTSHMAGLSLCSAQSDFFGNYFSFTHLPWSDNNQNSIVSIPGHFQPLNKISSKLEHNFLIILFTN